MKLVSFGGGGQERAGAVVDGGIVDLNGENTSLPASLLGILEQGLLPEAEQTAHAAYDHIPEDSVRLGAPIPRPSKVICVGLNYKDHAEETGQELPQHPLLFSKATSAVVGPYDDVILPEESKEVDYEVEFAVVIGKTATKVSEADAFDFVAGYTVANDVSGRDIQFRQGQWHQGKSYDTFMPMGPYLITRNEIPDPGNLHVECVLNGEKLQDSNTNQLIFDTATLVSRISGIMTLFAGDVISTGTPAGVGVFRNPKILLKPGDMMETTVDGIGTLKNAIK
ncbi:MAG: fumarylacetoacetate hydrolase family protein [Gemmatimonadota bacterium]|nr:fumarylacetoacetate hydrolase family protein [Gemmatimonadota bacterium]